MANIIVAIACNLVALSILISGIFNAIHNGFRVTLIKFIMALGGGVGAYFLTPYVSNKFYGIEGMSTVLKGKISQSTINGCIFLLWFLAFYLFTLIVCKIVRHCIIKKLRNKKLNKLKIKRAKSINPSAEKAAKKAEWRALKLKYAESKRWYHKLFSFIFGAVISIVVGYVILLPFGYISKDMKKPYLIKGYNYTLNGVMGEKVSDFLVHAEKEIPAVEEENKESEIEPGIEIPNENNTENSEAESSDTIIEGGDVTTSSIE